jgi:uncharacterized protein YdeI (YjbR/CyaY-like superfamily)
VAGLASAWSATERQQAERMTEAGLMTPAGQAAIDQAKADGSRNALDEVEATTLPDDLAAAFAVHPGSQAAFEAYPNYLRRDILEWIAAAKRDETRARRITETARACAEGRVVSHARVARAGR